MVKAHIAPRGGQLDRVRRFFDFRFAVQNLEDAFTRRGSHGHRRDNDSNSAHRLCQLTQVGG